MRLVGKYELGRTIGEGTFAKVKFAKNSETGEPVAIKILDKEKVLKHKMAEQLRREISTMKLIKHPYVIQLYEVMGSKTKIFIVLEFVTGGELFEKVLNHGRMKEEEARKYFQQLISAIDYCHGRGPENLLLDVCGNLKISDFGLSALSQQIKVSCISVRSDGPLFVILGGNYKYISAAEYIYPPWISFGVLRLITRILDPNPTTRITVPEILKDEWFRKGFKRPVFQEMDDINLDDLEAVFKGPEKEEQPVAMNAFELISLSRGLNLGNLFEVEESEIKRETRFTSKCPDDEIICKIEEAAKPLGFDVHKNNYKVFQMAPSLHMVEVRKKKGDTLEFLKFYKKIATQLKDVVWKSEEDMQNGGKG
ncbi:hypothetical protein MKW98_002274 [Papaver atlanticum]|uniref:non-specific serine/threonine protein kinase n=1 Tax=Papaver atlanticum TaxID=357466 RepID=A0AAD4RUK5_9MAGN|nr:hypothetical protein MKW98_002274 [Papaver atlanticum]